MVMVVFEVWGNCRTCSFSPAMAPTSRIRRLTTVASTGRRMKRSVNAFIAERSWAEASRLGRHGRRRQRGRSVDDDRRIGLQLDLPGGDDLLARRDPVQDGDPLAPRRAE